MFSDVAPGRQPYNVPTSMIAQMAGLGGHVGINYGMVAPALGVPQIGGTPMPPPPPPVPPTPRPPPPPSAGWSVPHPPFTAGMPTPPPPPPSRGGYPPPSGSVPPPPPPPGCVFLFVSFVIHLISVVLVVFLRLHLDLLLHQAVPRCRLQCPETMVVRQCHHLRLCKETNCNCMLLIRSF